MILSSPGLVSHRVIWSFADESLWVIARHRRVEEIDIVHGMVTGGRCAIGLALGLGISGGHAVGASYGCLRGCRLEGAACFALRQVDRVRRF